MEFFCCFSFDRSTYLDFFHIGRNKLSTLKQYLFWIVCIVTIYKDEFTQYCSRSSYLSLQLLKCYNLIYRLWGVCRSTALVFSYYLLNPLMKLNETLWLFLKFIWLKNCELFFCNIFVHVILQRPKTRENHILRLLCLPQN